MEFIPPIVLLIAFVVLTFYVLPPSVAFLKAKTEELKNNAEPNSLPFYASQMGDLAVRAAEQLYTSNADKKRYAVKVVEDYFRASGTPFVATIIEAIVESSVLEFKSEQEAALKG
jgi:hypothetical protein